MPAPNFYNINANRAFPFITNPIQDTIANSAIVDCGVVMGDGSGFEPDVHTVWLQFVGRAGSLLTFLLGSDAPGLAGNALEFVVDLSADGDYATIYADDTEGSMIPGVDASNSHSALVPCDLEPRWSGYLVVGRMDDLLAAFDDSDEFSLTSDDLVLEPALVQSTIGTMIGSLNIANLDRTRVTAADDCPPPEWPYLVGLSEVFTHTTCLRGDVRVKPGYNATVTQDPSANAIIISAGLGQGEGEPCDTPSLFPGEAPATDSDLFEGGPRCNDVVRSINGLGGRFTSLLAGHGIDVEAVPEENRVIVNVNMRGMAVCYSDSSLSL